MQSENPKRNPDLVRADVAAEYKSRTGVEPPELVVEHDRMGKPKLRVSLYFSFPDDAKGHAQAVAEMLAYFDMACTHAAVLRNAVPGSADGALYGANTKGADK